jgi:hypothetical protein
MSARRLLAVVLALGVVLSFAALAAPGSLPGDADPLAGAFRASGTTQETPCTGTVAAPADGWTVVSVQGTKFRGDDGPEKRAARLIAFGPEGRVKFVHPYRNAVWGYDVDPMANGNLYVTTTVRKGGDGDTRVFELDPQTGERVWQETFDALDTHDSDLVRKHSIAVANMRNYDAESAENRDRLFVYNRTTDEVTTEWQFQGHYPQSAGGNYEEDWTHVNDVEWLGGDLYVLSPREFDQVIVVNVSSGAIVHQLGEDDDFETLDKQHNPDYLRGEGGRPTMLVGDSENDRIVEYAKGDGEWERTWSVGEGQFNWPRDADRLPNGNTLVTDSKNHRVLEVTPEGEVVWEVYTPWLPYDAERIGTGDESTGPTTRGTNATGAHQLSGSAGRHEDLSALEACGRHLDGVDQTSADQWPPASYERNVTTVDGRAGGTWTGGTADGDTAGDALPADGGSSGTGLVVALLVVVALAVRSWWQG